MTTIIAAGVFIIAVIGFAVMVKNMKSKTADGKKPTSSPSPVPAENSPDQEYKAVLDSLLRLNLLMRTDIDFSDEMIGKIEAIIDDLTVIIPEMMDRYPGEALTYELKKIGKDHLYKTVKEYLDLSKESRENQSDIFNKTIESLHDVSNRSRDIVEKNETAEFKTMANFLAGKFS